MVIIDIMRPQSEKFNVVNMHAVINKLLLFEINYVAFAVTALPKICGHLNFKMK